MVPAPSDYERAPPVGTPEFQRFIEKQAVSAWDRACALWIVRIPIALFVVIFAWLTISDYFSAQSKTIDWVYTTVFCVLGLYIVIRGRVPRLSL